MKIPVLERLRATVAEHGDRVGLSCGDVSVTFGEVDTASNRLARAYAELGVGQGDLVTIALPNGIGFVESVLAVWKLGAIPQPVSWQLPEHERNEIVALAASKLVVGVDSTPDTTSVPVDFRPDPSLPDDDVPFVLSPSIRAMTSGGSTGRPKLIVANDPAVFDFDRPGFPVMPNAVQLVAGPMYHMAPFSYGVFGFVSGQHIVVLPKFDAAAALAAISRHRVTTAMVVPTMLLRMARAIDDGAPHDVSSIASLWHTGGPCPAWVKERWIDLVGGDRIIEIYGSTESIATCAISGTEWLQHRGSVGRPIFGEVKVVRDDGTEADIDEIGEIVMRRGGDEPSPFHYVGASERTLADGWQSIGDLGHVDADGYFYLSDRRTDMIVAGGVNIFPAQVEAVIGEHPGVAASAVVGLPDDDLGQRVHAVVQATPGVALDLEELRAFVSERLARPKVPRSFALADEPLLNEAGKLRRSAIRDRETARLAAHSARS